MQNILSTFSLSDRGSLIPSLLFFGIGIVTIILDLMNWRKERRQGRQHVWYQRIRMLTGVLLVITGLIVFTFTNLIKFGSPLYSVLSLVFLFAVVMLSIYAFLIIIRSIIRLSSLPQARFVGRINAEQAPVAANPQLSITRIVLIGGTFLLFVAMLLAIFQFFSLMTRHQLFLWGWVLFLVVPLFAFWLIRMVFRLRTLQRIEHIRFSLTSERKIDTASVFPDPESSVFFAPFSVTLRIKRLHIGILVILIIGILIPSIINLVVQLTQLGPFSGQSSTLLLIFLIVSGFALLTFSFIPLLLVRTTIEAKENGLRIDTGAFMHWQEARLFACYTLPEVFLGRSTFTIYELSSSSSVITWRWLHHPQSPFTIWKSQLPPDEYHQQMQAFCDLVIEKTSLRLHDLTQVLEEEETDHVV